MSQIEWLENFYEGRGVNNATGQVFQSAITFDPPRSVLESPGSSSVLTMNVVESSSELLEALDVDVSASLRVKTKGNVSSGAKFAQKTAINSYHIFAVITVRVLNSTKLIRNPVLKPEASKLLSSKGWKEFARSYGLEYIEGYTTGGTYYAFIEVKTTSSEKQQEISAMLSGSYSGFGLDAKVTSEAENKINQALSNQSVSVYVAQSGGGGGEDNLETSLPEMIKQSKEFPGLVAKYPVLVTASINKYENTVSLPDKIHDDDKILSLTPQQVKLEELAKRYLKLRDYKSSLSFALDSLDNMSAIDKSSNRELKEDELQAAYDSAQIEIDEILGLARQCSENPNSALAIVVPQKVKIAIPQLRPKLTPAISVTASVTTPTNAASFARLGEFDVPNNEKFEVQAKLSTRILEEKSPGSARFIGLGIYSTKSRKTVSIVSGITSNGHLLIANGEGVPQPTYRPNPGNVVYLKITKQAGEFDLLLSRDGLSFESLLKRKLTDLDIPVDDTYRVFYGGNSTDSTPISGKFDDLIVIC